MNIARLVGMSTVGVLAGGYLGYKISNPKVGPCHSFLLTD